MAKVKYKKVRALNPGPEFQPLALAAETRRLNPSMGKYFDTGRGQMIDFAYEEKHEDGHGREAYRLPSGRWLSGLRREAYGNLLERRETAGPPRWVSRKKNPKAAYVAITPEGEEAFVEEILVVYLANNDPEVLEALDALEVGQRIVLGGGAAPEVELVGLAGPRPPKSCCSACSVGAPCASETVAMNPARQSKMAHRLANGGRP